MNKFIYVSFMAFQAVRLSALDIPNPKIEFKAKMEDKSYEFQFKAINNTQQTESIDSVSGGCSCLSVMCDHKSLKPGEGATITGSFDFQTNVGKQRKTIFIKTSAAGIDSKDQPIQNEYKLILEGDIPSPIKISKSALIWIDGENADEKKVAISVKNGFVVSAVSIERDQKGDAVNNFLVTKTGGTDEVCTEFAVTPKATDLGSISPKFRDYFCRLNINYTVDIDGKKIKRTERLDLLLAKKPGKKYGTENSKTE